ncbi:CHD5-like protein-domain-containing protein [Delphinella strobiligena]|nr:CHD5-like protein-domain-containing protein [Delphinella strobiligena]
MISLILSVFLLNVVIHLVNTVGATTLNELLWILYNKLPNPTAKDAREATRLKGEVVRLKRELGATSAQDEFSKWAKIRRAHDKAVAEYEKSSSAIQASRSNFDRIANILRWLSTNGLRYLLQFWFSKQALFWLPQGWVPGYVEWLLAFPRAPTGSISIQVWGMACVSVVSMLSEAVVALYALVQRQKQPQQGQKGEPMAFESSTAKTDGATVQEKKEL